MVVTGLLLAGCGSSTDDTTRAPPPTDSSSGATATPNTTAASTTTAPSGVPHGNFDAADAALAARVGSAGLSGGMVRIVAADGTLVHEHHAGDVSGATPLAVASSAKWLTAATFMTFVDQGVAGLDDDIARWLPEFAGSSPPITPRQLLSHTSGVRDNSCQGDGTSLTSCVQRLASSAREFPAGTQFSYGNAPFLVVGRLIEILGGSDFATIVHQRLTGPLGMEATTWPGAPAAPNPAYGLRVTVDDYGHFLDMILNRGMAGGTQILSAKAVEQLVTDQVSSYDTTHDYSVGITRIPRYALGSLGGRRVGPVVDHGRQRQRRDGLLPLGRLLDPHLGDRRRTGRARRRGRGAGIAGGRGRGA